MAYRYGNRQQLNLFPPSIEDYIGPEDPVRAYDCFVETLDFNALGIVVNEEKIGNPSYNPKAMLKLLIYGPSYGIRSSRKLERATKHNLSFIWLMAGLSPDHKTIAEFRRNNKDALKKVLRQCARLCIDLGLIEGNTLFIDGTKIRANASIKNTWTKERCREVLRTVDERIDKLLAECETADKEEENFSSLVEMNKELQNKEALKTKVEKILKELNESDKKSINAVDSDCAIMKSVQGTHSGYNAQTAVDEKHGLIVNTDICDENNDYKQFAEQVNQANEVLGKKCVNACADAGYSNTPELEKIDQQDINVIVPSTKQAAKNLSPFDNEYFQYDSKNDYYICPEGNILRYAYISRRYGRCYMNKENACRKCRHLGICTKSDRGRTICRIYDKELAQKFETKYKQPGSQVIYNLRKQKVEIPFGHMKRNLGVGAFLLRGIEGVRAEMAVLATCFNLSRMITILGVSGLMAKLTG